MTQPESLQVLREWPPGFGGVERVAHELASVWGGRVYSFDPQRQAGQSSDSCPVTYPRQVLPCSPPIARMQLPWPSRRLVTLLLSGDHLHGHLPSPGVLMLLVAAKVLRPRRRVTVHWHSFLERSPGFSGQLFLSYQWLALKCVPLLDGVVTTSPVLSDELVRQGCRSRRVQVLPCCLSQEQEQKLLAIPPRPADPARPMRVLFIGRLASYKRLDWLLNALAELPRRWELQIVGDGPHREAFETLSDPEKRQLYDDGVDTTKKRKKKEKGPYDSESSESEDEDGNKKKSLREEVERRYFPDHFQFWPFGDPFVNKRRHQQRKKKQAEQEKARKERMKARANQQPPTHPWWQGHSDWDL